MKLRAPSSILEASITFQALRMTVELVTLVSPRRSIVVPSLCVKSLLMVKSCIKVRLDLEANKSPVVVKGPFFPRVVNPRYRIRGTNV
jgi:hypothetical protein